ncbi:MAG: hypothetical protein ACTSXD_08415 [Candidatus Heimdallarchaeaceae archaeon]
MKIPINFNVEEHKEAILNGTKKQTIRLCKCEKAFESIPMNYSKDKKCKYHKLKEAFDRGEECIVELQFKRKHIKDSPITEVFEIEIGKYPPIPKNKPWNKKVGYYIKDLTKTLEYRLFTKNKIESLAKANYFKDSSEMFKYLDKKYDLSEPERFMVTRWK